MTDDEFTHALTEALPKVRAFARFLTHDWEDLMQDTALNAWLYRASYQEHGGSMNAWLCTIMRNKHTDTQRRRRMRVVRGTVALDDAPPLATLPAQEHAVALREALTNPTPVMCVMVLKAVGHSEEEVAQIVGIKKWRVKRARRVSLYGKKVARG